MSRPARREISSRLRRSTSIVPPPTVPRPSRPTWMGFIASRSSGRTLLSKWNDGDRPSLRGSRTCAPAARWHAGVRAMKCSRRPRSRADCSPCTACSAWPTPVERCVSSVDEVVAVERRGRRCVFSSTRKTVTPATSPSTDARRAISAPAAKTSFMRAHVVGGRCGRSCRCTRSAEPRGARASVIVALLRSDDGDTTFTASAGRPCGTSP